MVGSGSNWFCLCVLGEHTQQMRTLSHTCKYNQGHSYLLLSIFLGFREILEGKENTFFFGQHFLFSVQNCKAWGTVHNSTHVILLLLGLASLPFDFCTWKRELQVFSHKGVPVFWGSSIVTPHHKALSHDRKAQGNSAVMEEVGRDSGMQLRQRAWKDHSFTETSATWFLSIYLHRCHFQLRQTKIMMIDNNWL